MSEVPGFGNDASMPTVDELRKEDEAAVQKAEDAYADVVRHLEAFAERMGSGESAEDVLDGMLQSILELRIAERVLIVLRDGDKLKVVRRRDPGHELADEEAVISRTLVSRCLERNSIDVHNDLKRYERLKDVQSIVKLNLQSSVCVPLRERGEAFGVLYLDSKSLLTNESRLLRLVEGYAFLASLALTLFKDLEVERKQLREAQMARAQALSLLDESWAEALIGSAPAWIEVLRQIRIAKQLPHTVLIEGESGTGKELVARAVAKAAANERTGPFVALNCAGLDAMLLEAALFGTTLGAFTGAVDRPGYVEEAEGGTLFLDEIGDMSPDVQQRFLRFLEDHQFRRLGSPHLRRANVRIIAATNRRLEHLVETGEFRRDLYFRISQLKIDVPPLRERLDDVPILVNHFLERIGQRRVRVADDAMQLMRQYRWPGNVRQLKTVTEIAAMGAGEGGAITGTELQRRLGLEHNSSDVYASAPMTLEEAKSQAERNLLVSSLGRHSGNVHRVATELGVTRQTVYNLLNRHKVDHRDYEKPRKKSEQ